MRVVWFIASSDSPARKIVSVKSACYGCYGFLWWIVVDLVDLVDTLWIGYMHQLCQYRQFQRYMQFQCQYPIYKVGTIIAYTLFLVVFTYHKKTSKIRYFFIYQILSSQFYIIHLIGRCYI